MKLLNPNTDHYPDFISKGKFLMVWRTTLFFLVMFVVLTVWTFFYDWFSSVTYSIITIIALFCMISLRMGKSYKPIIYLYSILGMSIVSITMNVSTGFTHVPDFTWGLSIVVMAFSALGNKFGWLMLVMFGLAGCVHFLFFFNLIEKELHQCSLLELTGLSTEMILSVGLTGYFMSQHLSFTRYAEGQMSLANAELELQNQIIQRKSDENAVLVKEIHHRVKNNLQIIISLLRMHRDEVRSEEAQKDFDEAINRILSMALLHQQMYREKELSRFNLEEYVTILIHDIVESYRSGNQIIKTDVTVQNVILKLEAIVPLGLLINELVSNSLKHAFTNKTEGKLTLKVKRKDNGFILEYSDDGVWQNSDTEETGFGSELVQMLSEQLNGKIERDKSNYILTVTFD